ncbi:transcription factor jumonji (jmjC)domain-containing protein [Striga asiatica]|uniref:Transcription factor jumonji (JmjC)domain-containing protein n=1 Tax=Striga asiatica TaxID=4170 RepID=A0A5A7QCD1_STRAF|nr:transcription factor jumonji (jmjC)domain-containing protein [Striga asiatica]
MPVEYLIKHREEFHHHNNSRVNNAVHPIHDQVFCLDEKHKKQLKEEFSNFVSFVPSKELACSISTNNNITHLWHRHKRRTWIHHVDDVSALASEMAKFDGCRLSCREKSEDSQDLGTFLLVKITSVQVPLNADTTTFMLRVRVVDYLIELGKKIMPSLKKNNIVEESVYISSCCEIPTFMIDSYEELLGRPWVVEIIHGYKEANFVADYLASLAAPGGLHRLERPPLGAGIWLHHDMIGVSYPLKIIP